MPRERSSSASESTALMGSAVDEGASADTQMVCIRLTSIIIVLLGVALGIELLMAWYVEVFVETKKPHPDPIYKQLMDKLFSKDVPH